MILHSFKKTKIRHCIREKLNNISFLEIQAKSRKIFLDLINLDNIKNAKSIFVYISLKDEVQTFDLIEEFLNSGKDVFVPKIVSGNLKIVKLKKKTKLVHGKFGILEPKGNEDFKGKIDVAIVPGIAFSIEGKRVGKGGGYYDKLFFTNFVKYKIGICFDFQILKNEEIPIEEHDILMDKIIFN